MSTQISKSIPLKKSTRQLIQESITKSSLLGAVWGAGHTTMLVLIGFLVYVLALTLQNQIFLGFEFAVGLMLVSLGISAIFNKKIQFKHKHPHSHKDDTIHLASFQKIFRLISGTLSLVIGINIMYQMEVLF